MRIFIFFILYILFTISSLGLATTTPALYPIAKIFDSGQLKVGTDTFIYYEQRGNPKGPAVIYNHGGPGGASSPENSQWFDLSYYRIILYDQRGTGKSSPSVMSRKVHPVYFKNISVNDMVSDLEALRKHLNIQKWIVFGGSWGSTLSLAYAEKYPNNVSSLVVYGIFLNQPDEMTAYYDFNLIKQRFPLLGEKALRSLYAYANSQGLKIKVNNTSQLIDAYYTLCVIKDDPVAQYLWRAYENFNDSPTKESLAALSQHPNRDSITPSDRSHAVFESAIFKYAFHDFDVLNATSLSNLKNTDIHIIQGLEDTEAPPIFAKKLVHALKKVNNHLHYQFITDGKHDGSSSYTMEQALLQVMNNLKHNQWS